MIIAEDGRDNNDNNDPCAEEVGSNRNSVCMEGDDAENFESSPPSLSHSGQITGISRREEQSNAGKNIEWQL